MTLSEQAGYFPGTLGFELIPGAGPQGQPVLVERTPLTFRDHAGALRGLRLSRIADGMGRVRELAAQPIEEPIRAGLAEGYGLATNESRIHLFGLGVWPGMMEARFCMLNEPYGSAGSTLDFAYDWIISRPGGHRERIARSEMTTTWVRVKSHGVIEAAPLPPEFATFAQQMKGQPGHPGSPSWNEPLAEPLRGLEVGAQLYRSPPGPRVRPLIVEREFDTTEEESNVVGNVYFSNYYHWQQTVRDLYIAQVLPDCFRVLENPSQVAPVCIDTSVSHLREAMPFDRILVTMSLRALHERAIDLYFEYFRVDATGGRQKLAFGEHRMLWLGMEKGAPVTHRIPAELQQAMLGSTSRE